MYIIYFRSVTALPDLVARQTCDSIVCPDWTKIWGSITGATAGSAAWWLNLIQPTSQSITIPENLPANPASVGPPVPNKEPEVEIFVTGESAKPNVCDGSDPSGSRVSGAEGNQVSNSRNFFSTF